MEIYYVACFIAVAITQAEAQSIESKISAYFNSDIVGSFQSTWDKYKKPLENAVLRGIKENYGYKAMNVYVRRMQDPYKISKGYCHFDNQVHISLANLELDDLPYLWMPEVTFLLPSNLLQIGATLSKMIIRSNYVVFRNRTQLIYDVKDQNSYQSSPFRFQQVQNVGHLGVAIEGCVITGMALATLVDSSVNLGFNSFKLSKCQYTFEIYTPGLGSPPVIAKYYPMGTGLNLEHLLMRSLREELVPKLQAAMFSYVNTSAILEDKLPKLRNKQEELFRKTTQYINDVVRILNKMTMEIKSGVVEMEDVKLSWNDAIEDKSPYSEIYVHKLVLSGLETAYSSHIGGPYKQHNPQICEEIRFSILRVRGNITHICTSKKEYQFIAEIQDLAVEVLLNVNSLKSRKQLIKLNPTKNQHRFHVIGWRGLELSVPKSHFINTDALLTGFLLNTIPHHITSHLDENFDKALEQAESKTKGKLSYQKHTSADHKETIIHTSDGEVTENTGNKPHSLMSSDDQSRVPVEPHSGKGVPPKGEGKQNLIQYLDETIGDTKLIGKEDEMIIPSDEILSENTQDHLSSAESSEVPMNAGMPVASGNEIISDK